jgi:serine/threonine protein kinase
MSFTEPQDANEPEPDLEAKSQDRSPVPFPGQADDFGLTPKPREPKVRAQRVDPLLGLDLGGVKIVKCIGEGGMGRVYEAHQAKPARTVAVKVIRQGITSEKTMRRFEREAEFLGKLQHL